MRKPCRAATSRRCRKIGDHSKDRHCESAQGRFGTTRLPWPSEARCREQALKYRSRKKAMQQKRTPQTKSHKNVRKAWMFLRPNEPQPESFSIRRHEAHRESQRSRAATKKTFG